MNIKRDISKIAKAAVAYTAKNRRSILTGITVAETFFNAYAWCKAGYNINDIYKECLNNLDMCEADDREARHKIVMEALYKAAPDLIVGVIATSATTGTILYNHKITSREIATLGAAYSATRMTLDATNNKIEELFGEKGRTQVRQSVAQDNTNKVAASGGAVLVTGMGSFVGIDFSTERAFRTCGESLKGAIDAISERINNYHWACLNDLYDEIGLKRIPAPFGTEFGWPDSECYRTANGMVRAPIDIRVTDYNGEPAYYLDYDIYPKPDYYHNS